MSKDSVTSSQRFTEQKGRRLQRMVSCLTVAAIPFAGCRKIETSVENNEKPQPNMTNPQSGLAFGSAAWKRAAAEDIRVTMISVLQREGPSLMWGEQRPGIELAAHEKQLIEANHVTGELTAVMTQTRGSGSVEVRIVIIQHGPIAVPVNIAVPERGSVIYAQEGASLIPLSTNAPASALVLQVINQPQATAFRMDYPRDRTTARGTLFPWDNDGHYRFL